MRVVKELIQENVRISIFSWNNKYIIKFEFGGMEQTFKLNEMEVADEAGLEAFWNGDFFGDVTTRFIEMGNSFRAVVENF